MVTGKPKGIEKLESLSRTFQVLWVFTILSLAHVLFIFKEALFLALLSGLKISPDTQNFGNPNFKEQYVRLPHDVSQCYQGDKRLQELCGDGDTTFSTSAMP